MRPDHNLPSPQAVRYQRAVDSEAFRVARAEALRIAFAAVGPVPVTLPRLRELGGYSAIAQRALEAVAPAEHEEPPYGDDDGWLRRALLDQWPRLRTELQIMVRDANAA